MFKKLTHPLDSVTMHIVHFMLKSQWGMKSNGEEKVVGKLRINVKMHCSTVHATWVILEIFLNPVTGLSNLETQSNHQITQNSGDEIFNMTFIVTFFISLATVSGVFPIPFVFMSIT